MNKSIKNYFLSLTTICVNKMRIVSGKYRHRLIDYPKDPSITRPTKDRIREALFSALGDINGMIALDLYAGSGALGLEALSRGIDYCYFVDNFKEAISVIKKNIESLKIESRQYCLLNLDDEKAINHIDKKINLVFLDPPYKEGKYEEIISLLKGKVLDDKYVIVCESDHELDFDANNYSLIKKYKYNEIYITILWRYI